jgi:hypothetical protein
MAHASFRLGAPVRPPIHHDNGFLDRFPRRQPTAADRARYAEWRAALELAEAGQHVPLLPHNNIPDALAAYRHFLTGQGEDRTFSYERYVASDTSGRTTLDSALDDAEHGAERIYSRQFSPHSRVHFTMTGSAIGAGGRDPRFPYPATENWQKAIGAHFIWISAVVDVVIHGHGHPVQFTMRMTLHAEDRYNFNPGSHDIATGIPDDANGIFEVTGLAHQYMNYATLVRSLQWTKTHPDPPAVSPAHPGRQRQPGDNRRARNRL